MVLGQHHLTGKKRRCPIKLPSKWECPVYKDSREEFMIKLMSVVGEAFKDFKALDNI